jgi:hypothetical protein
MTLRRTQRGQALTEFMVVALLLIPLFLLLPTIGKYLDVAHATQMASRYAAFEAMQRNSAMPQGWKPTEQLAGEVRRRFFSNGEAPVKTGDTAGDFDAHRNPLWRDSQGRPMIRDFASDIRLGFGADGQGSSHASGLSSASDQMPFGVLGPVLDIPEDGIYTASVSVDLADPEALPGSYASSYELLSKLGLRMTRHTALVVGPWAARDPAQVRDRIDNLPMFPGRVLAPIKPVVDAAVVIVESPSCLTGGCIRGPKLGELEFWDDVVPADRLK